MNDTSHGAAENVEFLRCQTQDFWIASVSKSNSSLQDVAIGWVEWCVLGKWGKRRIKRS
jgi:hypothetical protein